MTVLEHERCPDCEYAEVTDFTDHLPTYILTRPCFDHLNPADVRRHAYRQARSEWVASGDVGALRQMVDSIDEDWRP